jgi:hypothetical protein
MTHRPMSNSTPRSADQMRTRLRAVTPMHSSELAADAVRAEREARDEHLGATLTQPPLGSPAARQAADIPPPPRRGRKGRKSAPN